MGHPEDTYGRELAAPRNVGIGPMMAAEVVGDLLYTIGEGRLHILDIRDPPEPDLVGSLDGLGNTRQIAVRGRVVAITSREDGAFIVEVNRPDEPKLLCHYDAIEVATGVAISGDVLFLACRGHGVELVDISDPAKPRHLSTARTGESQSVAVQNGYAYVGVWGSSELVAVDVRDTSDPVITARCPLDGYGDGVAVTDDTVYIATGHHSRARTKSRPEEGEPGYGCGHGLEIYGISDPASPRFLSRIKGPPFYMIGNDMWSVKVAGDHAFVADTYNGVFVVNISDPMKPRFVAHRQLPEVASDRLPQLMPKLGLAEDSPYMAGRTLPSFVGGLGPGKDVVYVAGGWTDLHVLAAPGLARPVRHQRESAPSVPCRRVRQEDRFEIYRTDGQVRGGACVDDLAVVAAGSDGIHVVKLGPGIEEMGRYGTDGFAMAVATSGRHVFVAEEQGGLSIWRLCGQGVLEPLGRYRPKGRIVRDVVIPPPGRYALLQLDLSVLAILDLADIGNPECVLQDKGHGFLHHIADDLIDGRDACVLWQLDGVFRYDLYGEDGTRYSGWRYPHHTGGDGTAIVRNQALTIYRGGLIRPDPNDPRPPDELEAGRIPGHRLEGTPRVYGERLYLTCRRSGDIRIVDMAGPERPILVEHLILPGNPGKVVLHRGRLVIPNGYEGLWVEGNAREQR